MVPCLPMEIQEESVKFSKPMQSRSHSSICQLPPWATIHLCPSSTRQSSDQGSPNTCRVQAATSPTQVQGNSWERLHYCALNQMHHHVNASQSSHRDTFLPFCKVKIHLEKMIYLFTAFNHSVSRRWEALPNQKQIIRQFSKMWVRKNKKNVGRKAGGPRGKNPAESMSSRVHATPTTCTTYSLYWEVHEGKNRPVCWHIVKSQEFPPAAKSESWGVGLSRGQSILVEAGW